MTKNELNNLLFLVGATSALALACDINLEDGDNDTNAGTTSGGDGGTAGTTDADADADADADLDADAEAEAESVGESDVDGTTDVDADADAEVGDTGGDYSKACTSYAEAVSYCYKGGKLGYDGYVVLCQENYIDYYYAEGLPECATAYEELFACLGTLDCKMLELSEGCDDEGLKVVELCPVPDPGDTGGSEGG